MSHQNHAIGRLPCLLVFLLDPLLNNLLLKCFVPTSDAKAELSLSREKLGGTFITGFSCALSELLYILAVS